MPMDDVCRLAVEMMEMEVDTTRICRRSGLGVCRSKKRPETCFARTLYDAFLQDVTMDANEADQRCVEQVVSVKCGSSQSIKGGKLEAGSRKQKQKAGKHCDIRNQSMAVDWLIE